MDTMDQRFTVDLNENDRVYLQCEIESIPDFLQDHRLLDKELLGRLKEHCRRWTSIVNGLQLPDEYEAIWHLRYRHVPEDGRIYIGFFGSLLGNENRRILDGVRRSLESFGLKMREMSDERLRWWTSKKWKSAYAVEQKDEIVYPFRPIDVSLRTPNEYKRPGVDETNEDVDSFYLVTPFWGAGGGFGQPFDAMSCLKEPVELSVCLMPTEITDDERRVLSGFTSDLLTSAHKNASAFDHKVDPTSSSSHDCDWASRVYAANLRRLDKAFLCQVVVLADESAVAYSVAKSIESTVNEELPFESPVGGDSPLYSRAVVKQIPESEYEDFLRKYEHFKFALTFSEALDEFGKSFVQNFKGQIGAAASRQYGEDALESAVFFCYQFVRLRYLTDARGAATVFRFPVSVNSGVAGIDVRQRAPDYVPATRRIADNIEELYGKDRIVLGSFESGGHAVLETKAFRQHALVTGFTGSGKTQTVLGLLHQFWNYSGVPFLVLEAAKKEYRGLLTAQKWKNRDEKSGCNPINVHTLGNSGGIPFKLNPFEIQKGVRVELHVNRLATCFESAFPQLPFLKSILAEALETIYRRFGWRMSSRGKGREEDPHYPTMKDFVKLVEKITEERGYQGENAGNVKAATMGRLKLMLLGSAGEMFNCQYSSDIEKIFNEPTILELNDLNEQNKALATMFLLVFLREYRELHPEKEGLGHVTVVEEAHNILEKTERVDEESSGNSKAEAVVAFCNMLTELRAYGEGLIIADQSPNKLAPDAMRNTNVQIAHQLRDAHDREAVANAMIMSDEQRDFIGKLRPGCAAVFYTGLERATFLKIPQYYDATVADLGFGFREIDDRELRKLKGLEEPEGNSEYQDYFEECAQCSLRGSERCHHDKVAELVRSIRANTCRMSDLYADPQSDQSISAEVMQIYVHSAQDGAPGYLFDIALNASKKHVDNPERREAFARCFVTQLFRVFALERPSQELIDRCCKVVRDKG